MTVDVSEIRVGDLVRYRLESKNHGLGPEFGPVDSDWVRVRRSEVFMDQLVVGAKGWLLGNSLSLFEILEHKPAKWPVSVVLGEEIPGASESEREYGSGDHEGRLWVSWNCESKNSVYFGLSRDGSSSYPTSLSNASARRLALDILASVKVEP